VERALFGEAPMSRKTLTGLRPQAYEHPLDTRALDAVKRMPGLEMLVRKCNEYGLEPLMRVQYTGSNLRVNADNFPDLYEKLQQACEILDLPKFPELYIAPCGEINSFTYGVERPIVVLSSEAVDLLADEEIFFVIGHELGHIKSAHLLYYQMAELVPVIGDLIATATLGIGGALSTGLQIALLNWKRMSEFTADRAGLLAGQNVDAAIGAMMKIAGLPQKRYDSINTEDFVAQARQFEALDAEKLNRWARVLSVMGQTHPWTVMRANQFLAWIDGGGYQRVIDAPAEIPLALPPGVKSFCVKCGRGLAGTEFFCTKCGQKVIVKAEQ
jgi:Zn-dependent protease with chaperone function